MAKGTTKRIGSAFVPPVGLTDSSPCYEPIVSRHGRLGDSFIKSDEELSSSSGWFWRDTSVAEEYARFLTLFNYPTSISGDDLSSLKNDIATLSNKLAMLQSRIQDLIEQAAITTNLTSLGHTDITLRKPITITIQRDGDDFVASYLDANIGSGGPTIQLAVSSLQEMILDLFEMHEHNCSRKLGPLMKKQRNVLMEVVCRDSQKNTPKNR